MSDDTLVSEADAFRKLLRRLAPDELLWIAYLMQDAKTMELAGCTENEVVDTILEKHRLFMEERNTNSKGGRPRKKTGEPLGPRAILQRIRSQIVKAEEQLTAADIRRQYRMQKGKCWWCHVPVYLDFHIDHRVPLSAGGTNDPGNLVISCSDCNHSKSDKMPSEWNGRLL